MSTYANWGDLVGRYKKFNSLGAADEVNSHYIYYAERELDARLGTHFTTPFSSDNITAKDLTLMLVNVRYHEDTDDKKAKRLREAIEKKFDNLINGVTQMITTTSGNTIIANGSPVYSSTEPYTPTFSHGDIADMHVDPDLLNDEENARD